MSSESTDQNIQNDIFASTENFNLEVELENANNAKLKAVIYKSIYTDPNISHAEFRVYTVIAGYCGSIGCCFANHDQLMEDFKDIIKERTFQDHCQSLEKKGYLYRQQISNKYKGGSRSFYTVKCHWEKYLKHLKSKHYFPEAARVESFFTNAPYDFLIKKYNFELGFKSPNPPTSTPTPNAPKDDVSNNFYDGEVGANQPRVVDEARTNRVSNKALIEEQSIKRNSEKKDDTNPKSTVTKLSDFAAAFISNDSFRNALIKDLSNSLKSESDLTLAIEYIDSNRAKVEQASNPSGLVMHAIKNGYAREKVQAVQEVKRTAAKASDELSSNIAEAKKFQKETNPAIPMIKVIVNEYSVSIALNAFADKARVDQPKPSETIEIGFKDPSFKEKILQWRKKAHATMETYRSRADLPRNGRTGTE
jgi:hypothetical protein